MTGALPKFLFLVLLMTCSAMVILAQETSEDEPNPFDIQYRLSASEQATYKNPFDIAEEVTVIESPLPESMQFLQKITQKQSRVQNKMALFWSMTLILIVLTMVVTLNNKLINNVYKATTNDNFLKYLYKETRQDRWVLISVLYFLFLLNLGIFLFLALHHLGGYSFSNHLFLLLLCTLVVVFFYAKKGAIFLVGNIFPVQPEANVYNFMITIFGVFLGLALFPLNVMAAFAPPTIGRLAVFIGIGAVAIAYLFRSFRALFLAGGLISKNKFHFFLYLCTIEIAPLIIVVKGVNLWKDLSL